MSVGCVKTVRMFKVAQVFIVDVDWKLISSYSSISLLQTSWHALVIASSAWKSLWSNCLCCSLWTQHSVRTCYIIPCLCHCSVVRGKGLATWRFGTFQGLVEAFFMAALCSRRGHYIFILRFLNFSFFFFLFFLACSQPSQIGCLPYFHTWCGLSANLEGRSEMCCTRLAENKGRKIAKNSPSAHHHNFVRLYFRNWDMYRLLEKNLLNSNISSTCPHNMVWK